MDLGAGLARIDYMTTQRRSPMTLLATCLLAAGLLAAAPAQADVGIEKTSRSSGAPGYTVTLTIGCGSCAAASKPKLPASFPVSLVPLDKAPEPHPCGPRALCLPEVLAPPGRPPYWFLGQATPLGESESSSGGGGRPPWPRYRLHFEIPDLRPGVYAYVIFCDSCVIGRKGSLIADRFAPEARLRVRKPNPPASA